MEHFSDALTASSASLLSTATWVSCASKLLKSFICPMLIVNVSILYSLERENSSKIVTSDTQELIVLMTLPLHSQKAPFINSSLENSYICQVFHKCFIPLCSIFLENSIFIFLICRSTCLLPSMLLTFYIHHSAGRLFYCFSQYGDISSCVDVCSPSMTTK